MKPTVYGRQLVADNNGQFIGCNIGYNFYMEHEEGTEGLLYTINNNNYNILKNIKDNGYSDLKAKMYVIKTTNKENKLVDRWKNTPFKGKVVRPTAQVMIKNITIDNSSLEKQGVTQLLHNGDYVMLYLSDSVNIEFWKNRLGKKRIFSEDQLLNMKEYNNASHNDNVEYMLSMRKVNNSNISNIPIVGQWAQDGVMIFFEKEGCPAEMIVNDITDAIKRGCLAIVPEEMRIFKDRGCSLIILDKAYGVYHA